MKDQLVTLQTGKLAKDQGFDWIDDNTVCGGYIKDGKQIDHLKLKSGWDKYIVYTPTQTTLRKFIRENRGVHIEIHRNASGYAWSMCKSDGGTDLGYSDMSGPNMGGVWDEYEDALENAMQVQLTTDLKQFGHWGNYAEKAISNWKGK